MHEVLCSECPKAPPTAEAHAGGTANGFRIHRIRPMGYHTTWVSLGVDTETPCPEDFTLVEFCSACCPHSPLNLRIVGKL